MKPFRGTGLLLSQLPHCHCRPQVFLSLILSLEAPIQNNNPSAA